MGQRFRSAGIVSSVRSRSPLLLRTKWSPAEKRQLVLKTLSIQNAEQVVPWVADQHELHSSVLFEWRAQHLRGSLNSPLSSPDVYSLIIFWLERNPGHGPACALDMYARTVTLLHRFVDASEKLRSTGLGSDLEDQLLGVLCVRDCLASFSARDRQILLLHTGLDLPLHTVSRRLGLGYREVVGAYVGATCLLMSLFERRHLVPMPCAHKPTRAITGPDIARPTSL